MLLDNIRLIGDLGSRIEGRPQITTDGWAPYVGSIAEHFGALWTMPSL